MEVKRDPMLYVVSMGTIPGGGLLGFTNNHMLNADKTTGINVLCALYNK